MWHVDGNDKLIGFGFYIHGCVDGYSRKVIWLKVGLLLSQKLAIRRLTIRNVYIIPIVQTRALVTTTMYI